MKQKVTVIALDSINPSYRVETTYLGDVKDTHECNVIKINGQQVETKALSIEKEEPFIEVVPESQTVVDIRTSDTPIGSN